MNSPDFTTSFVRSEGFVLIIADAEISPWRKCIENQEIK